MSCVNREIERLKESVKEKQYRKKSLNTNSDQQGGVFLERIILIFIFFVTNELFIFSCNCF